MQASDFTADSWGRLVPVEDEAVGFVPNALPPKLELTWALTGKLSAADRALAELAGSARGLPNPHLLIGPFVRREAVLSSRIEGTQASLSDLFFYEAAPKLNPPAGHEPPPDVREVANYVIAMEYGLRRLRAGKLGLDVIRELHGKLMQGVRGGRMVPGEFRRIQNWIGRAGCTLADAVYVPPPPDEMQQALAAFEEYLGKHDNLPPLIRLALVHYQFEAIHPFLDGNGRIGRLLIALQLCHGGLLPDPVLNLSAYFEQRREEYYRGLLDVSRAGAWTGWIAFFLDGVAEQSREAAVRTSVLLNLWREYRERVQTTRAPARLLGLVDALFDLPVITIGGAARQMGVTHRAATQNVRKLVRLGILREVSGRLRNRIYAAPEIVAAIERPL
ncbi:MAG: Fic family protein [Verrucomicrobia bacterium]|nr:Fic family protein [Verrucomicrobiota bacterium]